MAQKFWTIDRLKKESKKYKTRSDFQKHSHSAYVIASREGLIEDLFLKHKNKGFTQNKVLDGHYNFKKNVLSAALRCKSRTEFQKKFRGAYDSAKRHGWFEAATNHMPKLGNSHLRLVYTIEIKASKMVYVGLTGNLTRRVKDHKRDGGLHVKRLLQDKTHKIVKHCSYIDSVQASRLERKLVQDFRRKGWHVVNKVEAGGLGGRRAQYTFERCLVLAESCKTRTEFRRKFDSASQAAQRYKWTNLLFSNHPDNGYTNRKWSNYKLRQLSVKCRTRGEFQKKFPSAYMTALKKGILDSIFKQHKNKGFKSKPPNYWSYERCQKVAQKAKTKSTLFRDFPGAYDKARKMGWLKSIFSIKNKKK